MPNVAITDADAPGAASTTSSWKSALQRPGLVVTVEGTRTESAELDNCTWETLELVTPSRVTVQRPRDPTVKLFDSQVTPCSDAVEVDDVDDEDEAGAMVKTTTLEEPFTEAVTTIQPCAAV